MVSYCERCRANTALMKLKLQLNTSIGEMNQWVERLAATQERLMGLVVRIVDRLADFEAEGRVELNNVEYDKDARRLRGTIRRITK